MNTKKIPLQLENVFVSIYGNFGSRFAAVLLEGLILAPLTVMVLICNSMRLNNYYYTFVICQLLFLAYFIYLPVSNGATPGKRIMGMTILKLDGSAIGYRESFLKVLPMLILALLGFTFHSYEISHVDAAVYDNLGWMKQSNYIKSTAPALIYLEIGITNVFYIINLIIFLQNKRKRSISDLLAGTVVVYTRYLDKINTLDSKDLVAVEN